MIDLSFISKTFPSLQALNLAGNVISLMGSMTNFENLQMCHLATERWLEFHDIVLERSAETLSNLIIFNVVGES